MMHMQIDVDGGSNEALGEADDLENKENNAFDDESCGICRDVVFDRGVLDCCQHWFCFACIDNWAAITNRCPLCKSEFQHIKCIPVYDIAGTKKEDDYSLSGGDDDWYVQGENNTLSFPSYYIDADAVNCLDNGGCKIRGKITATEEDLNFDTSIACDSCDIWYHAICVGFNPECTSEESWLCPRCTSTEAKQMTDVILKQNLTGDCNVRSSDGIITDASFSGRVSVSVADDGETAVVVSMVGGHSEISKIPSQGQPKDRTEQETLPDSYADYHKLSDSYADYHKLDLPLDGGPDTIVPGSSCGLGESCDGSSAINPIQSDFEPERSLEFSPIRESAPIVATSYQNNNMSNMQLKLSQHALSYKDLSDQNAEEKKNALSESNFEMDPDVKSPIFPSPGHKMATSTDAEIVDTNAIQQEGLGFKDFINKDSENLQLQPIHSDHITNHMGKMEALKTGIDVDYPVKKAKLEAMPPQTHLRLSCDVDYPSPGTVKAFMENELEHVQQDKSVAPERMSIVQERDHRTDPGRELAMPVSRKAGDSSGLRVKKIMTRKEEIKESSVLVQKLQKEIREAVGDTSSSSFGKDDSFDEKLLTVFRTAIGKPEDTPAKRVDPSVMRTRKSLLQKGKIRENLTKKLYGTSTGRRRSAWHREWEVEFWKYRCSSKINTEKIETLQSVLELLKKPSNAGLENSEMVREKKGESTNSILSRVYLADATVFPRKDDIKPLSALTGCSLLEKSGQNKNRDNIPGKDLRGPEKDASEAAQVKFMLSGNTGKGSSSSILRKEAVIGRENRATTPSSKGQDSQKQPNQSDDIKHDKRKWALEVLARKNASSVASKDKSDDGAALKGNYPLLAQLPIDMRPVPATSLHNKVPVSIRQAQLYRITEHYLRKANLDVVRKCADTELAVADAINVEKEIFEKSNSKLVYMNLCSQATRQHPKPKAENVTSFSIGKAELSGDLAPEVTNEPIGTGRNNVKEALRRAGLFDSPPNSPERKDPTIEGNPFSSTTNPDCTERKDAYVKNNPLKTRDEGPESIVDMNPQLDICGNSQCSLVEECYIATPSVHNNASRTSKPETETSDSRVRVMPSSLKSEDSLMVIDFDGLKHQSPENIAFYNDLNKLAHQPPTETSALQEHQKVISNSEDTDVTANETSIPKTSEADTCKLERKELSRPEKEPLVGRVPNEAIRHSSKSTELEVATSDLNHCEHENSMLKEGEVGCESKNPSCVEDKPPTHIRMSENALKKEVSNSIDNKLSDSSSSIYKKVEAYVKEHIRPLCKSGVITVEQYRWAVAKTTDKVMKYHCEAKNANFLIKEGEKVKKLALQYVEAAQQKV